MQTNLKHIERVVDSMHGAAFQLSIVVKHHSRDNLNSAADIHFFLGEKAPQAQQLPSYIW